MKPRPHACPAALAFLSAGPYDVRPHLVALYYADDDTELAVILRYGLGYMTAWCGRRLMPVPDCAVRGAVAHGLLRLWRPKAAGATDRRAQQLRMRAETFRVLSNAARDLYRQRLTEGAAAFVEVAAGSEEPRPAGTLLSPWAESTWWNRIEAGRLAPMRNAKIEVGSIRPPAHDPRAPSRDNGWLPDYDWAA